MHEIFRLLFFVLLIGLAPVMKAAEKIDSYGLQVTLNTSNGKDIYSSDLVILEHLKGQSPTSLLDTKTIINSVSFEGYIQIKEEGIQVFRLFHTSAKAKVFFNDVLIIETSDEQTSSGPIKLKAGKNKLSIEVDNQNRSSLLVRFLWEDKDSKSFINIPRSYLGHKITSELKYYSKIRKGRALYAKHFCVSCHDNSIRDNIKIMPELVNKFTYIKMNYTNIRLKS